MNTTFFVKNRIFVVITALLGLLFVNNENISAQRFENIRPQVFENTNTKSIEIAQPNFETLAREDIDIELSGEFRFGTDIPLNLDFIANAEQVNVKYGTVYLLKFKTIDAVSLSFNFSHIELSAGSKLWLYNHDFSIIQGAYTKLSISDAENFATAPLQGNEINIQMFVPHNESEPNSIIIESIVYGYKDLKKILRGFNDSGVCNVNINCEEGDKWKNEKRAVAMVLTANNTRFCSGSLINNIRQDATPYFLSANHCNVQNNSILMFNYESPSCSNIDGNTTETVVGGSIVSRSSYSDFLLFKANDEIPESFRPFFAGWSLDTITLDSNVCIHHPRGDIKKITLDYDVAITGNYAGTPNPRHWQILNWERGTTEPGSSGSPLFNKNKKIIGQLHGGDATCDNNVNDYYGKFNLSWDSQPNSNQQLKPWLDPDDTGITELEGFDPNPPPFILDADLRNIFNIPNFSCGNIENAKISVRNNGSEVLQQIEFEMIMNLEKTIFTWYGNLNYLEEAVIDLPILKIRERNNTLFVRILNVNGTPDDNLENNEISSVIEKPLGEVLTLKVKTDAYPEESKWTLVLENEIIVSESTSYTLPNFEYVENICAPYGCYTFIFEDEYEDGICCEYGEGFYELSNQQGRILARGDDFAKKETTRFCISNQNTFSIAPNPITNENLKLLLSEDLLETLVWIEIIDMNGKILVSKNIAPKYESELALPNISNGIYVVRLRNSNFTASQKLVVLRD